MIPGGLAGSNNEQTAFRCSLNAVKNSKHITACPTLTWINTNPAADREDFKFCHLLGHPKD
jgi:hypothetical protein